jgi:hypothetical protein
MVGPIPPSGHNPYIRGTFNSESPKDQAKDLLQEILTELNAMHEFVMIHPGDTKYLSDTNKSVIDQINQLVELAKKHSSFKTYKRTSRSF